MIRFLNRFFLFIIYSNLFIAGGAVLMAWQTSHLLLNQPLDKNVAGFIFFGSLVAIVFTGCSPRWINLPVPECNGCVITKSFIFHFC